MSKNPESKGLIENTKRIALIGGIGAASLFSVSNWDSFPECVRSGLELDACTPDADLGYQAPAEVEIGQLEKVYEDQIGTVEAQVFGEVVVGVGGTKSKVDYDSKRLMDFAGDVDATLFWNRSGNRVQRILYNPCIVTDGDYTDTNSGLPKEIDFEADASSENSDNKAITLEYEIDLEETGQNAGQVNGVTISAGMLDICFARHEESIDNDLNFTYHKDNQESVGTHEDATFRWMIKSLTLAYAQAEACPEDVVDIEVIKQLIAEYTLSKAIVEFPEHRSAILDAFDENKFAVDILEPEHRADYYREKLNELKNEIADMDRTFPNEEKDGKTYDLNVSVGDFAVTECQVASPVTITDPEEN